MYKGTLIAVTDMETSKRFYCDLLGMEITGDFGANVQLDGGLYLQTMDTWKRFIGGREVKLQSNDAELYFEVADIGHFCDILRQHNIGYVHPLIEHRWGQRVIRFYDPDHHIIEVAEAISETVQRFYRTGMTVEQVALRMDVPVDYVRSCLNGREGGI